MRLPLRRKGIFPMGGGVTVETTSAIVPAPVLLLLLLKRVSGKVLRAASADAMASTVTLPSVELPLALLPSTSKILVGLGVEAKGEVDGGGGGGGGNGMGFEAFKHLQDSSPQSSAYPFMTLYANVVMVRSTFVMMTIQVVHNMIHSFLAYLMWRLVVGG